MNGEQFQNYLTKIVKKNKSDATKYKEIISGWLEAPSSSHKEAFDEFTEELRVSDSVVVLRWQPESKLVIFHTEQLSSLMRLQLNFVQNTSADQSEDDLSPLLFV